VVINLDTAKPLGLTILPSVPGWADEVIQGWTGAASGGRLRKDE
jgi:hypothetical protein